MRYQDLEAALADLHLISEDERGAFRARLRVLRDMGVPKVAKPGKGSKVEYDFDHLWETAFALALERFGLPPGRASRVAEAARKFDLLTDVRQKEAKRKADIWMNMMLLGFEYGDEMVIVAPHLAPLKHLVAELKGNEKPGNVALLYGLINLSALTRNCETAISKL
jgi:hypothetical protein